MKPGWLFPVKVTAVTLNEHSAAIACLMPADEAYPKPPLLASPIVLSWPKGAAVPLEVGRRLMLSLEDWEDPE